MQSVPEGLLNGKPGAMDLWFGKRRLLHCLGMME